MRALAPNSSGARQLSFPHGKDTITMADPFSPDWLGQSAPWSYWPSSLLGVTPIARQDARERAGGTPNDAWDRATPAWLRSAMPPLGSGGLQGAFAQADGAAGQDSFVASPASTSPGTGRGILVSGGRGARRTVVASPPDRLAVRSRSSRCADAGRWSRLAVSCEPGG
jgi:hypothetical protein